MAVLLKEAAPAAEAANDGPGPAAEDLVPPFDVVTYAGPITVEGYERLSQLLEERQGHEQALVVLETPGGDPHAAFRIARALGLHYRRVEALVPRYCKSAGTLIVLGMSVLHMDNRGELGPLDMQVLRANAIASQGSALEFGESLDLLWGQQLQSFSEALQEMSVQGVSPEVAANAAAELVGGIFQPIAKQIDPMKLTTMSRAIGIAVEYGERLAQRGGNVTSLGVQQLVYGYPSHAFVIDRQEAQRLFLRVREPSGAVADVADCCRKQLDHWAEAVDPIVDLYSQPSEEVFHAQENSRSCRADGGAQTCSSKGAGSVREIGRASRHPGTDAVEHP